MSSEDSFSVGVSVTDLSDYILPSQACLKPGSVAKSKQKTAKLGIGEDGKYIEVGDDGKQRTMETTTVSLNDCLACSGCITSAESILIRGQRNEEFLARVEECSQGKGVAVASICPQSCASFAAKYGLGLVETARKLVTLFHLLGVNTVFDVSFGRDLAIMECASEFISRLKEGSKQQLPLLTSSCPGWICYAEKTHGDIILPFLATTKSPQAIMGSLMKANYALMINKRPEEMYHVSVMPCYDKKLEAAREEIYAASRTGAPGMREVDTVLGTVEVQELLDRGDLDLRSLSESDFASPFSNLAPGDTRWYGDIQGSDGIAEYAFKVAARLVHGVEVEQVQWKPTLNADFLVASLEVNGTAVLQVARAYGFRNIQNVVRRLKAESLPYSLVEVMACPAGCLNGGGQLRREKGQSPSDFLNGVKKSFAEMTPRPPEKNEGAVQLRQSMHNDVSRNLLHTGFVNRKESLPTNPVALRW